MEPIEKTVDETTFPEQTETKASTTIEATLSDAIHKEASSPVTSSIGTTATKTVQETKGEDMVSDDFEVDDEAIAAMIEQEEVAAADINKTESKPEVEPDTKLGALLENEQEEKATETTSLPSPPTSSTTTAPISIGKKEYSLRTTRAQSQDARQTPTDTTKNKKSEHATSIPAHSKPAATDKNPLTEAKSTTEEENDDGSEYEVEKIEGHRIYKGKVVKYEIKWKGYPQEDNTMEAASTIHDDVPELCIAYWDSLPNATRPSNAPVANSIAIDSNSNSESNTPIPTAVKEIKKEQDQDTTVQQVLNKKNLRKRELADAEDNKISKRIKQFADHVPGYMVKLGYQFPALYPDENTCWEKDLRKICVQASPIDSKTTLCYIEWLNSQKTIHSMDEVHERIPVALIKYYEERLQFI